MADDLQRRLEALGAVEPPPLDETRLEAIAARVMTIPHEPVPVRDDRRRSVLLVAAGLLALLVAGIVLVAAIGSVDPLRLDLAEGVTLELPDEAASVGTAGDELPDGAVLTIVDGGAATIDGQRFGPGRYVVIDGRIVELVADPTSTTTSTTTTTTARTRVTTTTAAENDRPVTATTDVRTPTRTTTTVAGPDDRPPVDGTRPDRPATTIDRPTTLPTSTTVRDQRSTTTTERAATTSTTEPSTTTTVRDRLTTTTSAPTTTTVRDRPPGDRP